MPFGQGLGARDLPHESPAIQHRQQHIMVGQRFEFTHAIAQPLRILSQLIDLTHQREQRTLHVRRQLVFGNAHDLRGVARSAGGRRRTACRPRRRLGGIPGRTKLVERIKWTNSHDTEPGETKLAPSFGASS